MAPRNPGEQLYYDRYGTVTPIPKRTMERKNSIQVCAILYIHQGVPLKEACRLCSTEHKHTEKIRKNDKWDEFHQELAQLTKPSNLTLVKSHNFATVKEEQLRRERSLEDLRDREEEIVKSLKDVEAGSQKESTLINNLTKLRVLIGEVTGYTSFHKEMSAARQAGLTAAAKEAPDSTGASAKKTKGNLIDIS